MTFQILINGGGIAGCATAYWLRAAGFDVTMVELAPAPRPGGQTVDLRGAGRTVVERMGLLDQVRERMISQRGIAWVDADGRRRAAMPVEAFGGNGIVSSHEVLRGDLADVLYQNVRDQVRFVFDDSVTAMTDTADGVQVDFERGPSQRFDLVIGADGLRSRVRGLAFADVDALREIDLVMTWFTVPAEVPLDGWSLLHNAVGGRVVSLRPGRLPGEQKAGLSFRTTESWSRDRATQLAALEHHFADVGWEAPRLLAAARKAPDLAGDRVGQVRLPSWSRGRVTLVGDAGYSPSPLTGLGTSLALVGGYVLAGELGRHGVSPAALERYEAVLRPYVAQAQQLPPGGANGYAPRSAWRIRMGPASMAAAMRWPLRLLMAKVFEKADAIDLPDYGVAADRVVS
jgi:2-polyprenyl-6-methoxyphenol hydroxylase-like FAD-dependent oxidoreductase